MNRKSLEYELLDTKLRYERELRRVTEKATRKALKLQAVEYERRLDDLNNAHARAEAAAAKTVSSVEFAQYKEREDERRQEAAKLLAAEVLANARRELGMATVTATKEGVSQGREIGIRLLFGIIVSVAGLIATLLLIIDRLPK